MLIALIDPAHSEHEAAGRWFAALREPSWATCPIVENAVLRIVGSQSYRNSPGPPSAVAELLKAACALPGHVFWPDSVSLLTDVRLDTIDLRHSTQITDVYLLALARSHGGRLATFDRRLKSDIVEGGDDALLLIPA